MSSWATGALRGLRAVGQGTRPWRCFSVSPCAVSSASSQGAERSATEEPLLPSSQGAKPYSQIPSKKGLPLLGTMLDFTSKEVRYKAHKVIRKRFEELGLIFREKAVPSMPEMVILGDPRDVETVFRAEGKWPNRPNIDFWEEVRKELSIPLGVLLTQEYEEWRRQRQPISQFMMVPRKLASYHPGFNDVAVDFVRLLKLQRDPTTSLLTNAPKEFFKWSFESIALFTLGKRLGCLDYNSIPPDCQEFIQHLQRFVTATQDILFSIPVHKLFRTKPWNTLRETSAAMYQIAMRHIEPKIKEVREIEKDGEEAGHPEESVDFLTHMLRNSEMSLEEISTNAMDLLGAGVDTTSLTLAWCMYCLARNPEVQEKLRSEVMATIGEEKVVTPAHINKMPYLRQCIKETQRMYPIAPAVNRILREDLVLSGYNVPAGTLVLVPIYSISTLPQNFPEPERFQPERWERGDNSHPRHVQHSFASLPFGFGARMCLGRRVAELELYIALTHLMKNFRVGSPTKEEIEPLQKIFLLPERSLDLIFSDL